MLGHPRPPDRPTPLDLSNELVLQRHTGEAPSFNLFQPSVRVRHMLSNLRSWKDLRHLRKLEKAVAVRNFLLESFPANFDAAGKSFPDFPAARNAIPAKVWAFSGKDNGCWKIGPRLRERCWIFSSETATAFLSSPEHHLQG